MKKLLCPLLCLFFILPLTACGKQSAEPEASAPTIRPAVFSEDTQQLMDLLLGINEALVAFDYTVDESIQSVSIDVWKYEDGNWVSCDHIEDNTEPGEYRMGFCITESGYDIFDISSSRGIKSGSAAPNLFQDFDACATTDSTQLREPRDIVCGEEVALWLRVGSSGDQPTVSLEDFRGMDCTAGLAVTVTFS